MRAMGSRSLALAAGSVAAAFTVLAGCGTSQPAAPPGVTVYDGARLIVGDGRPPIENARIVVDGARIVQAGPSVRVEAPAGAPRVDLTGKTVMPAIIDTHTHLGQTAEALTTDLRRRAYYGVGATLSMGLDAGEAPFQVRAALEGNGAGDGDPKS